MRLTRYEPSDESMFPYKLKDEELSTELDSIHKLGQLEDIEEELGIDLATLFKALKDGIYIRIKKSSVIHHYVGFDLIEQDSYGDYLFNLIDGNYYFKDYGKTWALMKEELL